jgi:predicted thioesterase
MITHVKDILPLQVESYLNRPMNKMNIPLDSVGGLDKLKQVMKTDLGVGAKREEKFTVTKELSVRVGKVSVLSTPSLVLLMERTSRLLLDPCLIADEASVGARIDVRHLAPTPTGSEVRVVSHVLSISGRQIDFMVEAYDAFEKIGEAAHKRVVVTLGKFKDRVEEKIP